MRTHSCRTAALVLLMSLMSVVLGPVAFSSPASAQGTLQVELFEDPFTCDAIVRALGTVSGLAPGEPVQFSSPQLNGVFSTRTADANGHVDMRWNCSSPESVSVTVRGLLSGASATFVVAGAAAPPPPQAPLGSAFDAKTAMTTSQMATWKIHSPYNTAGIYIPVTTDWDNRADKIQSNLNAGWVASVLADGWRLIPIYVGWQAPDQCATARFEGLSNDPGVARSQGAMAASDAIASVSQLGIGPGNPIYYDMEAYRPGCAEAVLAFLDAWTEGLHAAGYVSGVYGSRSSTMWDLSRAYTRDGFDAPDAVWVSTGNGRASSLGLEIPTDGLWTNSRIHQYRLSVTRTYGGVTLEVDENIVDAPLATFSPVLPTPGGADDVDGDGFTNPSPDNCDTIANPDQADLDNDGDGDVCDTDIDGDGVANDSDFDPFDNAVQLSPEPTPTTAPEVAPTPVVVDTDGDGVAEPSPDNCDTIANPDQVDLDNDGDGDVCDIDIDGDGVANDSDLDPRDATVGEAVAAATPEATPTSGASTETPTESTPTPEPVAADPQIEAPDPTPETTPEPEAEPAAVQAVIVLPTPLALTPTPVPTVAPAPTPTATTDTATALDQSPGADPDTSFELATDTVTISVENESNVMPYVLASLAAVTLLCLSLGVRSFRNGRLPNSIRI